VDRGHLGELAAAEGPVDAEALADPAVKLADLCRGA
jgi:hypothetical protein